nr:PepSY-associated TM helix domain-containing protein [Mangrovicoccus ximenensis]
MSVEKRKAPIGLVAQRCSRIHCGNGPGTPLPHAPDAHRQLRRLHGGCRGDCLRSQPEGPRRQARHSVEAPQAPRGQDPQPKAAPAQRQRPDFDPRSSSGCPAPSPSAHLRAARALSRSGEPAPRAGSPGQQADLEGGGPRRPGTAPPSPPMRPDIPAPPAAVGVRLDPWSGAPMPEAAAGTGAFFRKVTGLHRWLSLSGPSATGGAANAAANLGFLFLVLSGIWLWLPPVMRWSQVKLRLLFRRGLPTAQARDFNWHHVFGAWALVPLFVLALSGVVISYPWASSLVYLAAGETPPQGRGPGGTPLPASCCLLRGRWPIWCGS